MTNCLRPTNFSNYFLINIFIYVTNPGDCYKHSDCLWDQKCVLTPVPIVRPNSGSIFTYSCVNRTQDNVIVNLETKGKVEFKKICKLTY